MHEVLHRRATQNPAAIAIACADRPPLTYGRLFEHAQRTVAALRAFGVERNDRVAIVLPNGPEMATAFLTIACGATCAPLNPTYRAEEFEFYLSDLNARALVITAGTDSPSREVARKLNIPVLELERSKTEAGIFELKGKVRAVSGCDVTYATADDTALVLHTSGTTSRPKIVPLSNANVCTSGHNVALTLALTDRDRCLNVMPLFHIHGLIAAVAASATVGAATFCSPGFDADKFFGWMDSFEPTWYTAVPTIHQAVLARAAAHREIIERRPLRLIRSSSASLPPSVMAELETVFTTQVIEAYGMTEAAHQMASNPLAPRPRKPGSVGVAAGPDVAIMDDAGNLLNPGETGEIVIRGPNVTAGYENNQKGNQGAFTDGWFRTGDQGRFDADGYLFLTGRLKEIINRGGEKIAPREVDDVIAQHPAVAQVVTFAVQHPTLGEEVAAAVVLRAGAKATEPEIRNFAATQLADFKVPKQVLFLDEIPKGATGKLQRIGLANKLADKLAAKQQENFVEASSSVEQQLADLWKELLKVERVGTRDDFNVLGGDSLAMASMVSEVEGRYGIQIPIDEFLRCPTIETLAGFIQKGTTGGSAPDVTSGAKPIRDSFLRGFKNRILQILALYAPGYTSTRVRLHKMRGVSIGNNVSIGLSAIIETAYPELVSIGNNVSIGMRSVIIAHLRDSTTDARLAHRQTVKIEDDVYVGPGVIILPNVVIGQGAVISAGSVVARSVPPHTLVQGNPARAVARCGVSLGGGVSYEQFLRHLTPINKDQHSL